MSSQDTEFNEIEKIENLVKRGKYKESNELIQTIKFKQKDNFLDFLRLMYLENYILLMKNDPPTVITNIKQILTEYAEIIVPEARFDFLHLLSKSLLKSNKILEFNQFFDLMKKTFKTLDLDDYNYKIAEIKISLIKAEILYNKSEFDLALKELTQTTNLLHITTYYLGSFETEYLYANILLAKQKLEDANYHIYQMISFAEIMRNQHFYALCDYLRGKLYYMKENYSISIYHFEKALKEIRNLEDNELIANIYDYLSLNYKHLSLIYRSEINE